MTAFQHDFQTPRQFMEAGLTLEQSQIALDSMGAKPLQSGPSGRRYKHPWSYDNPIPRWIVIDGVKCENKEWANAKYEEVLLLKEDMPT